jgi:sodium pump decarboxylase gamma subunit
MMLGMGMVFSFLLLLIFSMTRLAAFFIRYGHLFPDAREIALEATVEPDPEQDIAIILAALTAKQRKS